MTGSPVLDDREDVALAEIVDGLVSAEVRRSALDAESTVHFASAMRIALHRQAHRPRSTQEREMAMRSIAAEIGIALRWNDRTVQHRMNDALALVDDYAATLDALAAGRISARHAAAIRDAGAVFADATERAAFEAVVLERACSDTPARTEAFARRIAEDLHPESITERFRRAEESRRVWVEDGDDGLGMLGVVDSITKVRAMYDRLTRQARAVRVGADVNAAPEETAQPAPAVGAAMTPPDDDLHDTRTLDQTRADLLCDLILTGQPAVDPTGGRLGAIRAHVQVTVPALTAAGVSDRGASLDGVSPIDADTARMLLADADPVWDRILTHPVSGSVLATDAYRVTAAMDRFLAARDVHCRFPGCRRPARQCDHDHNVDWARGGPTDVCNMACLCKRHHTLKTETEWTARQLPDGSLEWTSPLGRTTFDAPERYPAVAFVPEPDPPPY